LDYKLNINETLNEDKFRKLVESLNIITYIFDLAESRFSYVSPMAETILGYPAEFWLEKGFWYDKLHTDDYELANEIRKQKTCALEGYEFEYRMIAADGTVKWFKDITSVNIEEHMPVSLNGVLIDITDGKTAENDLRVSKERYKALAEQQTEISQTEIRLGILLENLHDIVFYETGSGGTFISDNISDLLGYTNKELAENKGLFYSLIHPDDEAIVKETFKKWAKIEKNKFTKIEIRLRKKDGEYIWIEDRMFAVKTANRSYWAGFMIDITEQKKVLEKIHDTEIRLSTVLSNLPNIVIYQSGNNKDFISENISEMIGYTPEEIFSEKYFLGNIMHPDDLHMVREKLRQWKLLCNENDVLIMEYRLKKRDGEYIWIEDHMFKVISPGKKPYLSGILIDITDRKLSEEKITQSLKEKEVMLKEIHHRVKNNLQVVSSLLKLQSSFLKDTNATSILLESQNRVRSMALVHQKLYQSKDFASVDFADYVNQLTMYLMDSYKYKTRNIQLNVKSDNIFIGIDIAIPCGLIINELVTNSLKYAFDDDENGRIDIVITNCGNKNYNITIRDNGNGFPKDIDFRHTKSLGLQLVNTLVNQIEGKIDMLTCNGTAFSVNFTDSGHSEEGFTFSEN